MTARPPDASAPLVADEGQQVSAWAASGAMALTGRAGSLPLGPPAGMVTRLRHVAELLRSRAAELGGRLDVDPLALLGERAALSGLTACGAISCGGATRLLSAGQRWIAVTLARPEDMELVPAWLGLAEAAADPWDAIERAASTRPLDVLVDDALLLGLPIGVLPDSPAGVAVSAAAMTAEPAGDLPLRRVRVAGPPAVPGPLRDIVVTDLTSLWAGPLCGSLLVEAGATVIKVESTGRPDGARRGPSAFFDLLNAGKLSVALDLRTEEGVATLRSILAGSDVVLEASRPRALEQLGIDASEFLAGGRTRVWSSITGHGRDGPGRDRAAFGDDAAVAGGLVCWDDDGPVFCADAVADPTSGLVAAAGVLDAVADGGRWLLDISMAGVAAHLAGPTLPADGTAAVAAPRARTAAGRGPRLGEHTANVLAGLPR